MDEPDYRKLAADCATPKFTSFEGTELDREERLCLLAVLAAASARLPSSRPATEAANDITALSFWCVLASYDHGGWDPHHGIAARARASAACFLCCADLITTTIEEQPRHSMRSMLVVGAAARWHRKALSVTAELAAVRASARAANLLVVSFCSRELCHCLRELRR